MEVNESTENCCHTRYILAFAKLLPEKRVECGKYLKSVKMGNEVTARTFGTGHSTANP
jgi:hypothetical protein